MDDNFLEYHWVIISFFNIISVLGEIILIPPESSFLLGVMLGGKVVDGHLGRKIACLNKLIFVAL